MTTGTYLIYIAIAMALIIVPGPNVLLIIANSVKQGTRAGLLTVAGTSTAMALQLAIVTFGISSILLIVADWFHWLRLAGAAYLIYLGIKSLLFRKRLSSIPTVTKAHHLFAQGFLVSIVNPKTLLFFSAFLPQFVTTTSPALPQLLILSVTFLVLAVMFDSGYALLSRTLFCSMSTSTQTTLRSLAGWLLICAGMLLGANHLDTKP